MPLTGYLAQSGGACAAEAVVADKDVVRVLSTSHPGRWSAKGDWSSRKNWRPSTRASFRNRRYSPAARRAHTGRTRLSPPAADSPLQARPVTAENQAVGWSGNTPVSSTEPMNLSEIASGTSPPELNTGAQNTSTPTGSASLSWAAPVARADGSALALSEISGYTVYYGSSADNLPHSIKVNDSSATSLTIDKLPAGTCFMTVSARDTAGRESGSSRLVAKSVR